MPTITPVTITTMAVAAITAMAAMPSWLPGSTPSRASNWRMASGRLMAPSTKPNSTTAAAANGAI